MFPTYRLTEAELFVAAKMFHWPNSPPLWNWLVITKAITWILMEAADYAAKLALHSATSAQSGNNPDPQPIQRINTESSSLLQQTQRIQVEADCFLSVSWNFFSNVSIGIYFWQGARTSVRHKQSFLQTALGSLNVITRDTYATIKSGCISMSSIITRSGSSFTQTYSEKPLPCRLFFTLITVRSRTAAE